TRFPTLLRAKTPGFTGVCGENPRQFRRPQKLPDTCALPGDSPIFGFSTLPALTRVVLEFAGQTTGSPASAPAPRATRDSPVGGLGATENAAGVSRAATP